MTSYYDNSEPLACGHFAYGLEVWWAILPGVMGGTACGDCAITTEKCGGKVDLIPTNEQLLDWLDYERAGIGIN